MQKSYYVYIMTNATNYVLYIGITNDLKRRAYEHRDSLVEGFTKQYKVHKLVYYEVFTSTLMAIDREKQLKAGSRKKKKDLVNAFNPEWRDLFNDVAVM